MIWSSLYIPKHSFIAWLIVLNRLSFKDRHARRGRITAICVLCKQANESRNHFFYCQFVNGGFAQVQHHRQMGIILTKLKKKINFLLSYHSLIPYDLT
jgi:hypothetical protein